MTNTIIPLLDKDFDKIHPSELITYQGVKHD